MYAIPFCILRFIPSVDQVELEGYLEQFKLLASEKEGGITRDVFSVCLGVVGKRGNLIQERLFAFFDRDSDGVISYREFLKGMSVLCKGGFDERVRRKLGLL